MTYSLRRCGRSAVALTGLALLFPAPVCPGSAGSPSARACHEEPVLVVPLRVHGGGSERSREDLERIVVEINGIWRSQAGICFTGEIVDHEEVLEGGMDLWFLPEVEGYNGYFSGANAIRVRDYPALGPAGNPARDGAARTAAHELGHGLGLRHRQDSDENLMRSKTFGWGLNGGEVARARRGAAAYDSGETGRPDCLCPAEVERRRSVTAPPRGHPRARK